MTRAQAIGMVAVAALASLLTLIGVSRWQDAAREQRIAGIVQLIEDISQRIETMEDPQDGTATTEVPCPVQGVVHTVCTPQKEGEDDAAYAKRHAAKVQAFIDACGG